MYVKVWLRAQASPATSPALQTTSTSPEQLSCAFSPSTQAGGTGLQPKSPPEGSCGSTGGVVSATVIRCVQTVALPHSSVAVHVRTTVRFWQPSPMARADIRRTCPSVHSLVTTATGPSQLSVAVSSVQAGGSHSTVSSCGSGSLNAGASVSTFHV